MMPVVSLQLDQPGSNRRTCPVPAFCKSILAAVVLSLASVGAMAASCDKACLEKIGDQYRAAYVKHDRSLAPFARKVRFTENNVEMTFPDGSWDTVTKEVAQALTLSDPKTGGVGIYTAIMQNDTPGFLAVRLKVSGGKITEVEHMLSTKRNLSGPPTPIGDAETFKHEPGVADIVPVEQRSPRATVVALGWGYFDTLQKNDGEIRNTKFSSDAVRQENGLKFEHIEQGFKSGRYRFNERVRDRDPMLVDEERGIVMYRGFIDHKGVLDEYTLTDGTKTRSVFREPHTWAFLEMFKVRNGEIVNVEATFIGAPYYQRSPWTRKPDKGAPGPIRAD
jgi:hypothetical protein